MSADNWRDCPKCKEEGQFREDYEIYSVEDVVRTEYNGQCMKCKYTYSFSEAKIFNGLNNIDSIKKDGL